MKRIILIFFLISGCTYSKTAHKDNFYNINFSKDLSIEEFKTRLAEYAKKSPYPNIDN
jgi:hypothetical protein